MESHRETDLWVDDADVVGVKNPDRPIRMLPAPSVDELTAKYPNGARLVASDCMHHIIESPGHTFYLPRVAYA